MIKNKQPEILALIPARGGSKGVPRKNLQPLKGKPLLAYTIEHARQTPAVSRIVVSTDDPEIADVARRYGAEVIVRPSEISGDTATSESSLAHALDYLADTEGYTPEYVVFLQATSPLRQPDDIQRAFETLLEEKADSLFSASPVHGFVWRHHNGELKSISYDYRQRPRRQDIGEDLLENGSIYIFKPEVLQQFDNRLGGKIAVYRMHVLDSFQVDEPTDLELVDSLLTLFRPRIAKVDLSKIRLLVLDFDGVMTDNRVLVDEEGREAVFCNRGDGLGLALLRKSLVETVVISTETNPVVAARCRKLDIKCVQASDDKLQALKAIAQERKISADEIAYVGNDINDLECMRWARVTIAPSDAVDMVLSEADLVTPQSGGAGVIRQVVDWIMRAKTPAAFSLIEE